MNSDTTIFISIKFSTSKYLQLLLCEVLISLISFPNFLLLIVPGIYVIIRLSFAFYAIVIENYSAADGIRESWQLVQGRRWWSVFWALFVVTILIAFPVKILISLIVGNAFSVSVLQVLLGNSPSLYANTINSLVFQIFQLISSPIFLTYDLLLFMNLIALRNREENML